MTLITHDFYNPFVAAAIITENGDRVPLWTNALDPEADFTLHNLAMKAQEIESMPWLAEVSVELQLAYLPIMRAVLTPPYREAIKLIDSDIIAWTKSILEVQFGYVTGDSRPAQLSKIHKGVIFKPDIRMGRTYSITLPAQGVGGITVSRVEDNFTTTQRMKRIDILYKLLEADPGPDLGKDTKVIWDEESVCAALKDPVSGPLLEQKIPYTQAYKKTWKAIWEQVSMARCWMSLVGNKLELIPLRSAFNRAPVAVFSLFDFEGGLMGPGLPDGPVFPILDVDSPSAWVFMPDSVVGMKVEGRDPATGELKKQEVEDDTTSVSGSRSNAKAPSPDTINPKKKPHSEGDNKPEDPGGGLQRAKAERTAAMQQLSAGVQLNLTSLGVPDILPGMVVNVRGIGKRYSGAETGNYLVMRVVHTFSRGRYTTWMHLIANTSPLGITDAWKKATEVNNKKVPESGIIRTPKGACGSNPPTPRILGELI
jgi:hypothetical protein